MKRTIVMTSLGCAAAVVLATLVATGQAADTQQRQASGGDAQKPDAKFLKCAAEDNLFEVQMGRLVAERAKQENVKNFARKMAQEHEEANQKIKEHAQRNNMKAPEQINEWQKAKMDHLAKLQGDELERAYMFHQVGAHHVALLEHHFIKNHGTDNSIKQLASGMIPDLERHLKEAQQIAQSMSGMQLSGTPISNEGSQSEQRTQQGHEGHQHQQQNQQGQQNR